ncbi:uncharacterized protein BYT42DRAFT_614131 [Radiomyces spectabilis]|uniref:uncharacterized protein n=1 Tax=Radiomyces spectabilis TaxID=64574 RepID=UPI00221FAC2A|nr:uncharacterized protein BYT42DRAFT_614131 [Radiomyces spectabilis]KAI8377444.1 hypothetical protein BYT42DRAFT_614131 [Radiomyces spectabilis]
MAMVISIATTSLSTRAKQCLSIPLLMANLLIPVYFSAGNMPLDLVAAVGCYNFFLRFADLFWIGPLLQGKEAYATLDSLHQDFWSCMRKFPKVNKADKLAKDKQVDPPFVKDKKFYHLLPPLLYHMAICDVFGAWFSTFTSQDMMILNEQRPVFFFFFFVVAVFTLNSVFNAIGYTMHLFYCLYYEQGSYSSAQWRLLMEYPMLATSLDELWSYRWHQLLRSTWLAFAFRPTRLVVQRLLKNRVKNPTLYALTAGSLAVFTVSGGMHEYALFCNIRWPVFYHAFLGQQQFFFVIHGVGLLLEKVCSHALQSLISTAVHDSSFTTTIRRIWVIAFSFYTFPYFLQGFAYWGIYFDNPYRALTPYVQQMLRNTPALHSYCGSLL